jgi:hypothetical protein
MIIKIRKKHLLMVLLKIEFAVNSKWEFNFEIKGSLRSTETEVCSQQKMYLNKVFASKYSDIRTKLYVVLFGPPKSKKMVDRQNWQFLHNSKAVIKECFLGCRYLSWHQSSSLI